MKYLRSSASDLRRILDENFTAIDIAEPLASFDATAKAAPVRTFMDSRQFDVVGVRNKGRIVGYVQASSLNGEVLSDSMIPIGTEPVLRASAPLRSVLEHFETRPWAFVSILGGVEGIVSLADLQKAPVRMWLFGLVSLIEMQMVRLIRLEFSGDSWCSRLKRPERLESAREIFADLQRNNAEIDLVDCLQWCDEREILVSQPKVVEKMGFKTKTAARSALKDLEKLRNDLAHSQDIVATWWPCLTGLVPQAEELLEALEAAADDSGTTHSAESLTSEHRASEPIGVRP